MANKKKKKKTIDIILPNYNSVPFIEETIKSVINQTYTNWRLYIVDDCSNKQFTAAKYNFPGTGPTSGACGKKKWAYAKGY